MIGSVIPFRSKTWDVLMLVVLVAGVVWTVLSRVPSAVGIPVSSSPSPWEGFFAPDFTLDTLQGEKIKLSDLRGKIVVVNFWATWCLPCREETPALEKAYEEYKDSGIIIPGVDLTNQDSLKDIAAFVQEFKLTYAILLDRHGYRRRYVSTPRNSKYFLYQTQRGHPYPHIMDKKPYIFL